MLAPYPATSPSSDDQEKRAAQEHAEIRSRFMGRAPKPVARHGKQEFLNAFGKENRPDQDGRIRRGRVEECSE